MSDPVTLGLTVEAGELLFEDSMSYTVSSKPAQPSTNVFKKSQTQMPMRYG